MENSKEGLQNNIDRAEQREATKDAEKLKAKYGGSGSHTDNINKGSGKKKRQVPNLEHDEDIDSRQSPHLNRKIGKEQATKVDNKSHLDGEDG